MHPTHPRRRPWPTVLLLVLTALLVALAAVVVVAPPAGAHSAGGAEPSNYRTRVLAVRPALEGVSVAVVDAGTRLRLHNASGREVVVLGSAQVAVPEWTVKLRTGRRFADVVGEVRWVPGPSPLPWLAGAALLAMAVVAATRGRRWLGALVAALALLVALDLVQLAGAWTGARPPLTGKLLSLGASAAGWALAALAVRQLLRRRLESGLFQLLLAAGLLTVVSGLGDLGFLLRSQLASSLPDGMVRAAVAAKLGLGLGALTAAALHLRALLAAQAAQDVEPEPDVEAAQLWDWDDDPLALGDWDDPALLDERFSAPVRVPVLHAVGGRASRRPERAAAAASSTPATVLPWPGHRRSSRFDDPDLPGGA